MSNETVFLLATNIFVIILCGGIFMLTPYLTRKSYLFGVKIPPEQSGHPQVVAMKRRYILTCLLSFCALLILNLVQFMLWREQTLLVTTYLPLLIVPLFLAAFVPAWKKALRLKAEQGWQVPDVLFAETRSSHTRGNLSSLPWLWYFLSFIIVVAGFVVAVARYPELPDMIAGHMDANFQPTRLVPTTWLGVLTLPLINVGTLALMVMVAIFIERAKLQIDSTTPQLSFAQHRIYRRRMGNSIGLLAFATILFIAISGLLIIFPVSPVLGGYMFWGGMFLIFAPIFVLIVVVIKTGQGGCKVKINNADIADNPAQTLSPANTCGSVDDKYWKLGMFYYNPEDPACIVENRFGTNIGFNYARWPAKIIVAALVIGIVAAYAWLTIQLI